MVRPCDDPDYPYYACLATDVRLDAGDVLTIEIRMPDAMLYGTLYIEFFGGFGDGWVIPAGRGEFYVKGAEDDGPVEFTTLQSMVESDLRVTVDFTPPVMHLKGSFLKVHDPVERRDVMGISFNAGCRLMRKSRRELSSDD